MRQDTFKTVFAGCFEYLFLNDFLQKFVWTKSLEMFTNKYNKIILEEINERQREIVDIKGTCLYRIGLMYIAYMILWTSESATLVQYVEEM